MASKATRDCTFELLMFSLHATAGTLPLDAGQVPPIAAVSYTTIFVFTSVCPQVEIATRPLSGAVHTYQRSFTIGDVLVGEHAALPPCPCGLVVANPL